MIKNKEKQEDILMFLLAAYPILHLYLFYNAGIIYHEVITLILFAFGFLNKRNIKNFYPFYFLCWFYIAIHIAFFVPPFKLTKLIPGGIRFFIFSIACLLYASRMNLNKLNKFLNYIFLFASILYFYQLYNFWIGGHIVPVILPISDKVNYMSFSYSELYMHQISLADNRLSSIFAEPSYWAQFCLLVLSVELFCDKNKNKLFTPMSIFIIIILLLVRSGVGVLVLALIVILKFAQVVFVDKDYSKLKYLIFLSPVLLYIAIRYVSSEIGQELIDRGNNISSVEGAGHRSAFLRIFYGWEYLGSLSFKDLLFGVNEESSMSSDSNAFFNCATYFILCHGVVGFVLLLIFLISNCIRNGFVSMVFTVVFLSVSLLEAIYLAPLMLICIAIIANKSNKNENYLL